MFKTTEGAAECEIRSVIRFLNARNVLRSEAHRLFLLSNAPKLEDGHGEVYVTSQ